MVFHNPLYRDGRLPRHNIYSHMNAVGVEIWVIVEAWWAHLASYSVGTEGVFPGGKSGQDMKPTTHLQLVPRSRKRGSINPLPHTPSWRSA
jgi:hypothetical protein